MNENIMYFYLKDHEKNNLQLKLELCQPKEYSFMLHDFLTVPLV